MLAQYLSLPSIASRATSPELTSMERKLQRIETNGRSARPDQTPTVFTEAEINAYLASDQVVMPEGVEAVKLQGESGMITGVARVDFDRVRAQVHSSNPLLSVFSGVHEVEVVAHGHGVGHRGYVHVESVSLDGIEVPHFALELFVEKYVTPRAPQVGMDSQFDLPDRIDMAVIGQHKLAVTQK